MHADARGCTRMHADARGCTMHADRSTRRSRLLFWHPKEAPWCTGRIREGQARRSVRRTPTHPTVAVWCGVSPHPVECIEHHGLPRYSGARPVGPPVELTSHATPDLRPRSPGRQDAGRSTAIERTDTVRGPTRVVLVCRLKSPRSEALERDALDYITITRSGEPLAPGRPQPPEPDSRGAPRGRIRAPRARARARHPRVAAGDVRRRPPDRVRLLP